MNILDDELYSHFVKVGSFSGNQFFVGDKDAVLEQKRLFLSGKVEIPKLINAALNDSIIIDKQISLDNLKDIVIKLESNKVVKEIYLNRIEEKLDELQVIEASYFGDWEKFSEACVRLYGKPDRVYFQDIIFRLYEKFDRKCKENSDPLINKWVREIKLLLPILKIESPEFKIPSKDQVENIVKLMPDIYRNILSDHEDKGMIKATEIKDVFINALSSFKLDGWGVSVEEIGKTAVSVDHELKEVNIPSTKEVSLKRLKALVVHEIGTHVVRRVNGERSNLKLLGLGFDHYLVGEEGIATVREQIINGRVDKYSGEVAYLSICLASGVECKPVSFRDLFNVLSLYFKIIGYRKNVDIEMLSRKSEENAWNRCLRTFRGTTGQAVGLCYPKDMLYRQGNIGVWNLILKNSNCLNQFNVGKYDPVNDQHINWLRKLHVID